MTDTAPPLARHTYWAVSHAVDDLVLIHEDTDSVRPGWYEATCIADSGDRECCWRTTGSEPVVEDAAHEHVAEQHPEVVEREKLILAAARAYCVTKFDYAPDTYVTEDARERHIDGDTASHARVESFRAAVNAALDAAQEDTRRVDLQVVRAEVAEGIGDAILTHFRHDNLTAQQCARIARHHATAYDNREATQ